MNNVTILRNLARIYVKFHESGQKKFDEKKKKKIRGESKMDLVLLCSRVSRGYARSSNVAHVTIRKVGCKAVSGMNSLYGARGRDTEMRFPL